MTLPANLALPDFVSTEDYASHLGNLVFWSPYVDAILQRHRAATPTDSIEVGFNATYPTFLCGDVVVKLYGHVAAWRKCYEAERAALRLVATDPNIPAPSVLATGQLFPDALTAWPYLLMTRTSGAPSWQVDLSREQQFALAADLGACVRRLHALDASDVVSVANWPVADLAAAAKRSSLPPHLLAQIGDYVAGLGPFDRVFTHSDLTANHIFVDGHRLLGIIDWGDAMATDRHYELIQVYRDTFNCDKSLFRTFLQASQWPIDKDFSRKALSFAFYRQAIGLTQHRTMDVFEPIAAKLPLNHIATLDELASALFDV